MTPNPPEVRRQGLHSPIPVYYQTVSKRSITILYGGVGSRKGWILLKVDSPKAKKPFSGALNLSMDIIRREKVSKIFHS